MGVWSYAQMETGSPSAAMGLSKRKLWLYALISDIIERVKNNNFKIFIKVL